MGMGFNNLSATSLGQLINRLGNRVQAGGGLQKPAVTQVPSPNFNDRPGGSKDISAIVLHHTAGGTLESNADYFKKPSAEVSAHYIIGKDGRIVQPVQDGKRAWHAGKSEFKGREDVNDFSLGIEIVNTGSGSDPFPDAQYKAIIDLVAWMVQTYNVPMDRITGHKDVAVPRGRKNDPAPNFDWSRVRAGVEAKLKGASAPATPAPAPAPTPAASAPKPPAAAPTPALQTVPLGSLDSLTLSNAAQAQLAQPLTEVPLGAIVVPSQVYQPAVQLPQPAPQATQPVFQLPQPMPQVYQPTPQVYQPAVQLPQAAPQVPQAPAVQPRQSGEVQSRQGGAVQPRFSGAVTPRFAS